MNKKQYIAEFIYNPLYGNDELRDRLINEAVEESEDIIKNEKNIEFYSDKDNYDRLVSSVVGLKVIKMSNSST